MEGLNQDVGVTQGVYSHDVLYTYIFYKLSIQSWFKSFFG